MSSPTNLKEEKLSKDAAFFEFLGSNKQSAAAVKEFQDEEEQIPKNNITKRAAAFAFTTDNNENGGDTQAVAVAVAAAFEEDLEKKQMVGRANAQGAEEDLEKLYMGIGANLQQQATASIQPIPSSNNGTTAPAGHHCPSPPGAFRVHRTGAMALATAAISTAEMSIVTGQSSAFSSKSTLYMMSSSDALSAIMVPEDEEENSNQEITPIREMEEVMDVVPIPTPEEQQQQQQRRQFTKSRMFNFGCLFFFITAIFLGILFGSILPAANDDDGSSGSMQDRPPPAKDQHEHYPPFDDDLEASTRRAITEDPTSPQYKANLWMWEDPNIFETYPRWRQLQRFGMVTKYHSLHGDNWFHNDNWLSYNVSECEWWSRTGPTCDEEGRMVHEDLSSNNLQGNLPLEGQLSFMRHSDHSHNQIYGTLPTLFMDSAVTVMLSNNSLAGPITVQPGRLPTNLRVIKVDGNQLEGNFLGVTLQYLTNLRVLNLTGNRFGGALHTQVQSLHSNVKYIAVGNNLLSGTLPREVGNATVLRGLDISGNPMIHGTIPTALASLDTLVYLDISGTSITGEVPPDRCAREEQVKLVANCSQVQCCQD